MGAGKWLCRYCGCALTAENGTVDHVVPVSRGGKNTMSNMVAACFGCNNDKADRTPEEWRGGVGRPPCRPARRATSGVRIVQPAKLDTRVRDSLRAAAAEDHAAYVRSVKLKHDLR